MTPPEPAAGLVDALVQTSFVTTAVLSRIGAEHNLSLTQLRVLAILRDRRVGMSGLAGYLGLDRSTMSGLVDRAEKRGLLRRAPNPRDGRVVEVHLSEAGQTLAATLYAEVRTALAPILSHVGANEQTQLQTLLERVLAAPAD